MLIVWIVIAAWGVLGVLFLYALMATAKREDRTSRRIQHTISPFDDATLTRPGEP
jgi:hypothetical protein